MCDLGRPVRAWFTMPILGITAYRWRSFIGVWNDARRGSHPTAGYWADGCLSTRFRLFPRFSGVEKDRSSIRSRICWSEDCCS